MHLAIEFPNSDPSEEKSGQAISIECVERFNDLSGNEIAHILRLFNAPTGGIIDDPKEIVFWKRLQVFKLLTGVDDTFLTQWEMACVVENGVGGDLVFQKYLEKIVERVTDFLFDEEDAEDGRKRINPTLTLNPYPKLNLIWDDTHTDLFGPGNDAQLPFRNLSLYELAKVFTLFDAQKMPEVLATLYRPQKRWSEELVERNYDGDIRQPLQGYEHTTAKRAQLIEQTVPPAVIAVLTFWVSSCRVAIANRYTHLFNVGGSGQRADWVDFTVEMVDGDITKKDVVMQDNAHSVLEWAQRVYLRNKRNAKGNDFVDI